MRVPRIETIALYGSRSLYLAAEQSRVYTIGEIGILSVVMTNNAATQNIYVCDRFPLSINLHYP